MKIKPLIITTEETFWMQEDIDEILRAVRSVQGAEVDPIEVIHFDAPDKVPVKLDSSLDVRIDFGWFQTQFTDKYQADYNAICFHFTEDLKEQWGLARNVNGVYWNDQGDNAMEFYVIADDGQKSTRRQKYKISQFARVYLHELAHGIVQWTHHNNYKTNEERNAIVHDADYLDRDIKALFPKLSFIKYNLLKQLAIALATLIARMANKSRIDEWAAAIKEFEGWYEGSRSYRHNNPGNLRWSPYEDNNIDNFSWFSTYEKGWDALKYQLTIAADGRSGVYNPEMTIQRFFEVYAPSMDNNHPLNYAKFVANKLGVSINTKIKTLL